MLFQVSLFWHLKKGLLFKECHFSHLKCITSVTSKSERAFYKCHFVCLCKIKICHIYHWKFIYFFTSSWCLCSIPLFTSKSFTVVTDLRMHKICHIKGEHSTSVTGVSIHALVPQIFWTTKLLNCKVFVIFQVCFHCLKSDG